MVEQETLNLWVEGSSPSRVTIRMDDSGEHVTGGPRDRRSKDAGQRPATERRETYTDESARALGFADVAEMQSMVLAVDFTDPQMRAAFALWKKNKGTRAELKALLQ